MMGEGKLSKASFLVYFLRQLEDCRCFRRGQKINEVVWHWVWGPLGQIAHRDRVF